MWFLREVREFMNVFIVSIPNEYMLNCCSDLSNDGMIS